MADAESPAKRVKLDFSEHLRILVGPSKQEFMVHKDVITRRSSFFQAAASQRWSGSGSGKVIELSDDDPAVFSAYLECLYTGVVHVDDQLCSDGFLALKLYMLADKLGDLKSMNCIIDSIIKWSDRHRELPDTPSATYVVANTMEISPLRRLMVDFHVQESAKDALDDVIAKSPLLCGAILKEFGRLKAGNLDLKVRKVFNQACNKRPKCYYHQHDEQCPPCASDSA
ncbi:hypothetical protein LTR97_004720 [Elasticomyces elasticus]|uniref:BTB domain-containing protein n=1 Tax=Elasticomyces elasticus TaxID=574655 RepID=A0AAN7WC98_9PEZI|nr:hypothetical protein LTR97_004720 [Elasticomyces elasticus]